MPETMVEWHMGLQGKGFFIWQAKNVDCGNAGTIAARAAKAGLSHVLLKIADGNYPVNIDKAAGVDYLPPIVLSLKAKGIQAWGWHYIYGYDPVGEARIAIQRIQQLQLHGYVIDAEGEYKLPGRETAALRFMHELRNQLPNFPIALSSFRFPSLHRELPWRAFLDHCDYNMPQVYWMQAANAGGQLQRCVKEFQNLDPVRPIIPTGPAFKDNGWRPTEVQVLEFLQTARELKLSAVNFFSLDECIRNLGGLWNAIASYSWEHGGQTPQLNPVQKLFVALNTSDPKQVVKLYANDALLVTPERTVAGVAAIQHWHESWMQNFSQPVFNLLSSNGASPTYHFTWKALAKTGQIQDGSDTIGLVGGKIAYHYRFFTVSPLS